MINLIVGARENSNLRSNQGPIFPYILNSTACVSATSVRMLAKEVTNVTLRRQSQTGNYPFLKAKQKTNIYSPLKTSCHKSARNPTSEGLCFKHRQHYYLFSFNFKSLPFRKLLASPFIWQASHLSFYSCHYLTSNYFFKSNKLPGLNH